MKNKEMLKACPHNDGEYCNHCEYHGEYCDGRCDIAEALNNLNPVKAIFEEINDALAVEMHKANKHSYNPKEESEQRGARAALNNVIGIIGQIEKRYTEREGTDNGTINK